MTWIQITPILLDGSGYGYPMCASWVQNPSCKWHASAFSGRIQGRSRAASADDHEIVVKVHHARNAPGIVAGKPLLVDRVNGAGERHDALCGGHVDLAGIDIGIVPQRIIDVVLDLGIGTVDWRSTAGTAARVRIAGAVGKQAPWAW